MRLNISSQCTRIGTTTIHGVSQVIGLDARADQTDDYELISDRRSSSEHILFSYKSLQEIEKQLAIIVPCMNEAVKVLEGVLQGIPHCCLIILVSNSDKANYSAERSLLETFCADTQRIGVIAHQKNTDLARAFRDAGLGALLVDPIPRKRLQIREGKGEALVIGVAIAKLYHKEFVGFVDADNLVPGAVHEYCKAFAAGIHIARQQSQYQHNLNHRKHTRTDRMTCEHRPDRDPHIMVRLQWNSKPKIEEGKLVAKDFGRCSCVVNRWMNRLLNTLSGTDTEDDMIQTANAGEHAMSMDLAMELHFATGYAVEPYELIEVLERSVPLVTRREREDYRSIIASGSRNRQRRGASQSGRLSRISSLIPPERLPYASNTNFRHPQTALFSRETHVIQVRTCNPHIHNFGKGEKHIEQMQLQGLNAICHSRLAPDDLKLELRQHMRQEICATASAEMALEPPRVYPHIKSMDFEVFQAILRASPGAIQILGNGIGPDLGY